MVAGSFAMERVKKMHDFVLRNTHSGQSFSWSEEGLSGEAAALIERFVHRVARETGWTVTVTVLQRTGDSS